MEEIWRDIKGFEGKYQVSDCGRVKSLNFHRTGKEKIMRPTLTPAGYNRVCLRKDGKAGYYSIHRLVYETFIGLIPEDKQVNHINEVKTDNRVENLNLLTPKENSNWGTRNKRISKSMINDPKKSKQVIQLDKNGRLLDIFQSSHQAERETGIKRPNISKCCLNKTIKDKNGYEYSAKTAGGFKWYYSVSINPFILRLLKDEYFLRPFLSLS